MGKEKLSVQAGWKLMGTSWTMPLDIKKKKKKNLMFVVKTRKRVGYQR